MSEAQLNEAEVEKIEASQEPEFEIQVEDDTPPEDRNRTPLPQNMVEELEKDDLEEYSDKVKKRLSQMKKVWHDERREKERFAREREEALRFAQAQAEENKKLKERIGVGQRAYLNEITRSAKNELDQAKATLKAAYESGDSEAITDAQEKLTDVKLRLREYEKIKPQQNARQEQENEVQQPQRAQAATPQPAPQVDQKAKAWQQKNPWFGPDTEMTSLALGLHEKLVRSGVDPTSDEYYREVDSTMRKRFPEKFEDEDAQTTEQAKPVRAQKAANVVAPATRSTAPKQIRLTQTQVALAKRLGLSNEAYARELIKLENN
jgi:hypothetical protein